MSKEVDWITEKYYADLERHIAKHASVTLSRLYNDPANRSFTEQQYNDKLTDELFSYELFRKEWQRIHDKYMMELFFVDQDAVASFGTSEDVLNDAKVQFEEHH
jgi:hypothetical protein